VKIISLQAAGPDSAGTEAAESAGAVRSGAVSSEIGVSVPQEAASREIEMSKTRRKVFSFMIASRAEPVCIGIYIHTIYA
jgi:hypothetical protein